MQQGEALALLAMLVMKALMSSCVGQLFWQGASAHLRQRAASLSAPRSLSVVCLMSSKLFSSPSHVCSEGKRAGVEVNGLMLSPQPSVP